MSIAIALAVLVFVIILFVTERLPLPVTAMIGALAMAVFGIISFEDAFAGFGSDILMMVVGMLIIGKALFESGLVSKIGAACRFVTTKGERASMGVLSSTAGLLSAFMSNTAIAASFLALADSFAVHQKGLESRRNSYMAIGAMSVLGGNLTLIGSTPQLVAQGLLETAGLETMGFFTLFKGGVVLFIIGLAYYLTFGIRLLKRPASQTDTQNVQVNHKSIEPSTRKMVITGFVFVACILCFMLNIFTVGIIAIAGALALIVTRCIDLRTIQRDIDWSTVVILGGSLGFTKGLEMSGAGEFLARSIIDLFGGAHAEPLVIYTVLVILVVLLTNFMSNTAVVAMMVPIGIFLSAALDFNVLTMVIGIILAASACIATPIGSPPMTLTLFEGYRFKDYLKVGTPLCILLTLAVVVCVPMLYGV